jgi:CheY-like chemotaxis protein
MKEGKERSDILVIDDDYVTRFIHRRVAESLKGFNLRIQEAVNGRDALEALQQILLSGNHFPDFILLDLYMPIMDGFDFLAEFNKLNYYEHCVPLVVTDYYDGDNRERSDAYGVKHFFVKPLIAADLQLAMLDTTVVKINGG